MAKFHINPETGDILPCRAQPGKCLYGNVTHYSSLQEGKPDSERMMKEKYGQAPAGSSSFRMELSKPTQRIVDTLVSAGVRPLIVGGSVRDQFISASNKDIDMELYGSGENGETLSMNDVAGIFRGIKGMRVDETGVSFAVLKVRYGGEDFDLSLPRTEMSTGEKHTDYDIQYDSRLDFAEASSRRDFTINSMGYDPTTKQLIDPHNGQKDLQEGVLRHVSEAFSDDPLRCLRAVNFSSRFGYRVAPETLELCQSLAPTYPTIARERVEEEFNKVLWKGKHCDKGLATLHDIGWSKVMPPFAESSREELEAYGETLNEIQPNLRKFALSRMMIKNNRPDPTKLLESSGHEQKAISNLHKLFDSDNVADFREAHRNLKKASQYSNAELKETYSVLEKGSAKYNEELFNCVPEQPAEPLITGKFLLDKGFKPGPEMGVMIKRALRLQDEDDSLSQDDLFALIQSPTN